MAFESEVRDVVFTIPQVSVGAHTALIQTLIEKSPPGSSIRICISHFDKTDLAEALAKAKDNGVDVGIIIQEKDNNGPVVLHLRARDLIPTVAKDGCFGLDIHTKLFLFSRTALKDGPEMDHVIVAGSLNLTTGSEKQHQNAFVISDQKLFDGLTSHWNAMKARALNPLTSPLGGRMLMKPPNAELFSTSGRIKCYLFPRSANTYPNIIDNLHGSLKEFLSGERPRIRVAMSRWTDGGMAVFNALSGALFRGCRVDLALRHADTEAAGISKKIRILLPLLQISLAVIGKNRLKFTFSESGDHKTDIHSKYLIVDGHYGDGDAWETIVWSGSPNWTDDGLNKNDEILFKFRDAEVHRRFAENHAVLMAQTA